MALVVKDRVQEATTTSGTGTLTFSGPIPGFQSFSSAIGNGNTTFYTIYDNVAQEWEVGIGTVGPGTLARTTVLSNSSGTTSSISLAGNSSFVFCTYPAEKSINYDADGVATIGEVLGYSDTGIIGSFASTVAGYNQVVVQNKSTATNASTNFNVSNDAGTSGSNYAELGINSSTFVGTGSFNIAGASYVASASTDLTLGTYGAYSIHFVTNSNTTDAMTIYNNGGVSLGTFGNPGIKNIAASKFVPGYTAVTSAAGTTVLTADSNYYQNLVGSTTQTFQLPDATTLLVGTTFVFDNNSTGVLTIVDNASGSVDTLPSGAAGFVYLANNSTVAGSWNRHSFLPVTYDFNATTANFGGATITNALWNGTTIGTGYGGTGLTTFAAANNAIYSTSSSALAAGTLPIQAGGTAATTFTANGVLYGNGTSALGVTAVGTTGQVLIGNTGAAPSWGTVSSSLVSSFQTSLSGLTPSTATTGAVTLAGTLGATSGGTSFATYATGDIIYASATNTLSKLTAGTNGYILTLASGVPSWASNNAATTRTTTDFTATASQTTFTVSYIVGYIDVYRNGVKLAAADYTATNGTSVVLATGANSGDVIQTVAYSALSLGSGVTSFSGGTTGFTPASGTGNVVLSGTLNVANGGTGVTTSTGTGNTVLSASPTFTGTVVAPTINAGAATALTLQSAGTTAVTIDTSQKVLVNTTSARTNIVGGTPQLQVEGTDGYTSSISVTRNESGNPSYLFLNSTGGTSVGSNTIVANGANLGTVSFQGMDGTNFIRGAGITAQVDGTPGTNDMPGRLLFSTTADGASSPTERMRIDSSGNVGIGTTSASGTTLTVKGATANTNPGTVSIFKYLGTAASPTESLDWPTPVLSLRGYDDFTKSSMLSFGYPNDANYQTGDGVWNFRLDGVGSAISSSSSTNLNLLGPGALVLGAGSAERMRIHASGGVSINNTTDPGAGNLTVTGKISDSKGDVRAAPINSKTSAYVLVAADAGQTISITTGGVTVNASLFSAGDMVSIFNNSGTAQTITQGTSVTLRLSGTASTGNRTLAQYGVATLLCVVGGATPTFACTGAGLT